MTTKQEKIIKLIEWDRQYHWHPFTQAKIWNREDPLIIERGEGNFLIDVNGKRYLDGVSSLWTNVHGHNHPKLNQALFDQANAIAHSTLLGLSHPKSIELAKKLIEIAPKNLSKVFYSDNGSTAVEVAVKMAFQYWQQKENHPRVKNPKSKIKFMSLENAYHGDTLGSVSVGGVALFNDVYKPLLFQSIRLPCPNAFCSRQSPSDSYFSNLIARTEQLFKAHNHETAAVIVEPLMQGASGMLNAHPGYLNALSKMCRDHDVLLIADEVATGFGRTGKMFACEWEGVEPDFLCLAKGITGGYLPLAATLTTDEIASAFYGDAGEFRTFFHGHTYTGNPLACAVALANIALLTEPSFFSTLKKKISYLEAKLKPLFDMPNVADIRQVGLMVGIELVKGPLEPFPYEQLVGYQVCMKAREFGLFIRPLADVIVLMPPLSITEEEMDFLVEGMVKALKSILTEKYPE